MRTALNFCHLYGICLQNFTFWAQKHYILYSSIYLVLLLLIFVVVMKTKSYKLHTETIKNMDFINKH